MNNNQKIAVAIAVVMVPLVMLLGFNFLVVQPQLAEQAAPISSQGLSVMRINNPVLMNQTLSVQGTSTLAGAVTASGGVVGNVTGDVTGDITGNISGSTATFDTLTTTTLISQSVGFEATGNITTSANVVADGVIATGNVTATGFVGNLTGDVTGNVTGDITGTVTGNVTGDLTGDVVATSITLNGETFTGTVHYGTAASYTSGEVIEHGFSTTPTVCLLEPVRDVTSTLTIAETSFSSDMADVAEPIFWMCGQ